jgi:hypothetical protein
MYYQQGIIDNSFPTYMIIGNRIHTIQTLQELIGLYLEDLLSSNTAGHRFAP